MSRIRRVLIVDDEPLGLRRLEIGLRDIEGVGVVGSARDGRRALAMIDRLKPDIVLLDIEMPHLSGIEAVAALSPEHRPAFVFVTAHREFSLEAFELQAVDYVLKPFAPERLAEAVTRACRRCDQRDLAAQNTELQRQLALSRQRQASSGEDEDFTGELWLEDRGARRRVAVEEIDWVAAEGDYVRVHTAQRSYLYRSALKDLLAELDPAAFLRVHRSAFVRLAAVGFAGRDPSGQLWLSASNAERIPVGRSYAPAVRERLFGEREDGSAVIADD